MSLVIRWSGIIKLVLEWGDRGGTTGEKQGVAENMEGLLPELWQLLNREHLTSDGACLSFKFSAKTIRVVRMILYQ